MKTKAMLLIILCLVGSTLIFGQATAQQQPMPEKQVTAAAIPGVVAAGAKIERVWTGLQSADGVIGEPDGTVLLLEQRAHRVSRVDRNGKITLWLEDINEAGGIAIDPKGRYISVERDVPRVRVLAP